MLFSDFSALFCVIVSLNYAAGDVRGPSVHVGAIIQKYSLADVFLAV